MEHVIDVFRIIAEVINIVGITILIFGFTKELLKYLRVEFSGGLMNTTISAIQRIRGQLGIYILLALDFLIASDIILSIVELTYEELIQLATTVILRIAIGYFLGKEIEELEDKIT